MSSEPQPEAKAKYTNVVGDTVKEAQSSLASFTNISWENGSNKEPVPNPNKNWMVTIQKPTAPEGGTEEPTDMAIVLTIAVPDDELP